MKEERINPNFNINAKYESMIEEANKIIKVYLETTNLYEEDGRYNLAYDVKNYLPKLLEENKSLQSQLKAKEEAEKEFKKYVAMKDQQKELEEKKKDIENQLLKQKEEIEKQLEELNIK